MLAKEKPFRSEKYKAWVRTHDCFSCGWPASLGYIECHHVRTGGMGTKTGDDETVSLCGPDARGCHRKADKSPDSVEKYLPIARELFREWREESKAYHERGTK